MWDLTIQTKNFGSILYSRDLYLEKCQKHLFDENGTYEYTEKSKDLILEDVKRRILEDVTRRLKPCRRTASVMILHAQGMRSLHNDS